MPSNLSNKRGYWRRLFALLMVLQLAMPYYIFAAAVGKFTSVVGTVTVTRDGVVLRPVVNSPVNVKDLIATGEKSSATLLFVDDSNIRLHQNSKMEVKEFMIKDKTRKGILSMTLGRLTAGVSKFIGGNNVFEVHSPTAVAGVRGTGFEFIVALVGAELSTTVSCTAGILSVSALSAEGVVIATATIVAGQTAVVTATGITVSATTVGATGAGIATADTVGAGTGTTVTTATGTGTVTTTGAAAGAGATAGTVTAAGVTAGTVAAAAVGAAVVVGAVVQSAGSQATTVHH